MVDISICQAKSHIPLQSPAVNTRRKNKKTATVYHRCRFPFHTHFIEMKAIAINPDRKRNHSIRHPLSKHFNQLSDLRICISSNNNNEKRVGNLK